MSGFSLCVADALCPLSILMVLPMPSPGLFAWVPVGVCRVAPHAVLCVGADLPFAAFIFVCC